MKNPEPLVFDPEWLSESCGGDSDMMRELMRLFANQARELWPALQNAYADKNHEATRRLAHKLAGSCGSCGLSALTESLRTLEGAAISGRADAVKTAWKSVAKNAAAAADEIRGRFQIENLF